MTNSLIVLGMLFLLYFMFSFPAVLLTYFPNQLDKQAQKKLARMQRQRSDT